MNNSREESPLMGMLDAGNPSGELVSVGGASREPPAAPGQSAVQASVHNVTAANAQRLARDAQLAACGYAALEADFRANHETNAARRRGPYEHYRLVYRYGYDLGMDTRYRDAEWADVARAAGPRWEARNPGTWALFQETIRYAWDKARRHDEISHSP